MESRQSCLPRVRQALLVLPLHPEFRRLLIGNVGKECKRSQCCDPAEFCRSNAVAFMNLI